MIESNANGIIQGNSNIMSEFTQKGKLQINALSLLFQTIPLYKVYSSTLTRAKDTSKEIYASHKKINLPIEELPELNEMNMGIVENCYHDEVRELFSKVVQKWMEGESSISFPDGESPIEVIKRGKSILTSYICNEDSIESQHILIVTHGIFLRCLLPTLIHNDDITNDVKPIEQDNACINIFDYNISEKKFYPRHINYTSHLENI